MRSASALTGGQGVVERLGLLVTMDNGNLTALDWYNFDGCNGCDSSLCVTTNYDALYQTNPQESCAFDIQSPECAPCTSTDCKVTNCSTTVMGAFRGSTKSGQALQSAYQLTSAFKYSISDVLGGLLNGAEDNLGNVNAGAAGTGVDGGTGTYLPTPLPLPGGAVSDEQLSAAQNGEVMPPPPQPPNSPPPPPSPSPPPPSPEPVPVPVPDPVVVTSPPAVDTTTTTTTPIDTTRTGAGGAVATP